MNRLILLALAAAALSAAADEETGPRDFKLILPAHDVLEECVRLKAGERRAYEWTSDRPVDFNVHYHQQKEIFFPVKKDKVTADRDTFLAKSAEFYCWMWTTGDKPTRIEGKIAPPGP